jgi:hypothetical protein
MNHNLRLIVMLFKELESRIIHQTPVAAGVISCMSSYAAASNSTFLLTFEARPSADGFTDAPILIGVDHLQTEESFLPNIRSNRRRLLLTVLMKFLSVER